MMENEKLLEEKRELLRKMSEAEEMGSQGMRTASTVQHRCLNETSYTRRLTPVFLLESAVTFLFVLI